MAHFPEEMYGCGTQARGVLRTEWIILMGGLETAGEKNTKGWQPLPAKARLPALPFVRKILIVDYTSKYCTKKQHMPVYNV
jgi:hypothetical protein